jgi:hypothetical protein
MHLFRGDMEIDSVLRPDTSFSSGSGDHIDAVAFDVEKAIRAEVLD